MKDGVTKYESMIKVVESESRILTIAYKLQGGEVALENTEPAAEPEEPATAEPTTEQQPTTEERTE